MRTSLKSRSSGAQSKAQTNALDDSGESPETEEELVSTLQLVIPESAAAFIGSSHVAPYLKSLLRLHIEV